MHSRPFYKNNMRFFIIAFFTLAASFAVPQLASAQACTANSAFGSACSSSSGSVGTCSFDEFGTPVCVTAGNPGNPPPGEGNPAVTLINPLKSGTSLESFLTSILAFVIRIGSIAIILMLVFVGYKFVVAQGNPGEIEAAKKMLLWTIIGALILLGAQAIALAIKSTVTALGG